LAAICDTFVAVAARNNDGLGLGVMGAGGPVEGGEAGDDDDGGVDEEDGLCCVLLLFPSLLVNAIVDAARIGPGGLPAIDGNGGGGPGGRGPNGADGEGDSLMTHDDDDGGMTMTRANTQGGWLSQLESYPTTRMCPCW